MYSLIPYVLDVSTYIPNDLSELVCIYAKYMPHDLNEFISVLCTLRYVRASAFIFISNVLHVLMYS